MDEKTRRGVTRWVVREVFGGLFIAVLLALAAGDWHWTMAYVLAGLYLGTTLVQSLLLIPYNPGVLAERSRRIAPGTKSWDRLVLGIYGAAYVGVLAVAALQRRWSWAPPLPVSAQAIGIAAWVAGNAVVTWAMAVNAFFAVSVRLQSERGQVVVRAGPYRYVRHPGYVGAVLIGVGAGLLLGSSWSLLPGAAVVATLVLRTALEDRMLRRELAGYEDYARATRWRLLPGIW